MIQDFCKRVFRVFTRIFGSFLYRFVKIDNNLIVFQSEGDFWDNARALYEYMIAQNLNLKYKLVWLVNDPSLYVRFSKPNVSFVKYNSFSFAEMMREQKIMRSARFFFFTHRGYKNRRKNQTVVNLWHGAVAMKAYNKKPILYKSFDYQSTTSYATAERMERFTGMRIEQAIINGECRQDYLFSDCDEKVKTFLGKNYDSYILGMPTFKKTKKWTDGETESWILPVIKNKSQFEELNAFCQSENVLLILKVHHLEDTSFINANNTTNIRIIHDNELQNNDIQLYELIGKTDALLSDFSSVAYDYMLIDKPIGYFISDIQNYNRGFIIDNIQEEMAGEKISSINDLKSFIYGVNNGIDNYKNERKILKDKFFVYQQDGNCERLLKYLKLIPQN